MNLSPFCVIHHSADDGFSVLVSDQPAKGDHVRSLIKFVEAAQAFIMRKYGNWRKASLKHLFVVPSGLLRIAHHIKLEIAPRLDRHRLDEATIIIQRDYLSSVVRGKRARVKQKPVWQGLIFQNFKYIRFAVRIGDKEIKPRSIRIQFLLLPVHS